MGPTEKTGLTLVPHHNQPHKTEQEPDMLGIVMLVFALAEPGAGKAGGAE